MATSVLNKGYTSFGGVDMKAVTETGDVLATLQALSYSVTREKAQIWTLGSADPRSTSRGKRATVGTLVFIVFDRHSLMGKGLGIAENHKAYLDVEEINAAGWTGNEEDLGVQLGEIAGKPVEEQEPRNGFNNMGVDNYKWSIANYSDQLTPFDVVMVAANEYGHRMKMAIVGAEVLNEGTGVSIDDITTEQQMTYIARGVVAWTPISDA